MVKPIHSTRSAADMLAGKPPVTEASDAFAGYDEIETGGNVVGFWERDPKVLINGYLRGRISFPSNKGNGVDGDGKDYAYWIELTRPVEVTHRDKDTKEKSRVLAEPGDTIGISGDWEVHRKLGTQLDQIKRTDVLCLIQYNGKVDQPNQQTRHSYRVGVKHIVRQAPKAAPGDADDVPF